LRVLGDLGSGLGLVRVDADDRDALGRVVAPERGHAVVVGVRDGTLRRDEDDRDGLVLREEVLERDHLAVGGVRQREVGGRSPDLQVRAGRGGGERGDGGEGDDREEELLHLVTSRSLWNPSSEAETRRDTGRSSARTAFTRTVRRSGVTRPRSETATPWRR